jgi:hypothetical protein
MIIHLLGVKKVKGVDEVKDKYFALWHKQQHY